MRRRWLILLMISIVATMGALGGEARRRQDDLTEEQIQTLNSLEQINDHPLYIMHYYGDYPDPAAEGAWRYSAELPAWACSLVAALGDENNRVYGRNFDWDHSPALLLYTEPSEGYASVSMVDLAYFGFQGEDAIGIADLPLEKRRALLDAPLLPFDGMNERGLAIAMAAVEPSDMPVEAGRETMDSIGIIRAVLDRAATVDEALEIFNQYNIQIEGGPPLHYLIADAAGQAVLIEFYQGEMVVTPNEKPWLIATNFICAAVKDTSGQCWRYDTITEALEASGGRLTAGETMDLLADVSQPGSTQWSVVYNLTTGEVQVATGRDYEAVVTVEGYAP